MTCVARSLLYKEEAELASDVKKHQNSLLGAKCPLGLAGV